MVASLSRSIGLAGSPAGCLAAKTRAKGNGHTGSTTLPAAGHCRRETLPGAGPWAISPPRYFRDTAAPDETGADVPAHGLREVAQIACPPPLRGNFSSALRDYHWYLCNSCSLWQPRSELSRYQRW